MNCIFTKIVLDSWPQPIHSLGKVLKTPFFLTPFLTKSSFRFVRLLSVCLWVFSLKFHYLSKDGFLKSHHHQSEDCVRTVWQILIQIVFFFNLFLLNSCVFFQISLVKKHCGSLRGCTGEISKSVGIIKIHMMITYFWHLLS